MSCVAQRCVEDKNNAERRVTSTTESLRDRSDRAGGRRAKGRDKGRASPRRRGGERALRAGEPAHRTTARAGEIEIGSPPSLGRSDSLAGRARIKSARTKHR